MSDVKFDGDRFYDANSGEEPKALFDFEKFKKIVREMLESGEVKCSRELTEMDLAVQFAIAKIGERRGYPLNTTPSEIVDEIMTFAPEVLEE